MDDKVVSYIGGFITALSCPLGTALLFGEMRADLFYCGPDDESRAVVEGLIKDVGLRPVHVGDLDQVRHVDAIGSLWVTLALRQGVGRQLAFKLLSR